MNNLYRYILILAIASPVFRCGERIDSELDAARVAMGPGFHKYQVSVAEVQPGWGKIRAVAPPDTSRPMAITGCIGAIPACDAGVARPFILYASPEVLAASDASAQQIVQGRLGPDATVLEFPFPVNFQQGIVFNITTYYEKVHIRNGWVVLPAISSSADLKPAPNTPAEEQQRRAQLMQSEMSRLQNLSASKRVVESFTISVDWEAEAMRSIASSLQQLQTQFNNPNLQNPNIQNQNTPNQNSGDILSPNTPRPDSANPNVPGTSEGNLVNEDILNQGATNYCWGYSAFHMMRQYYFATDKGGAWAQAISKINTTEAMASYMRANHTNQSNHMMTWIEKFMSINPELPNDGWNWQGTISSAAQKLQQSPSIPSSYCDGRHCTALIGFTGGTFTVADSSGGYTYKAGANEIGQYRTVSLSSSGSGRTAALPISNQTNNSIFPSQGMTSSYTSAPSAGPFPFVYGLK